MDLMPKEEVKKYINMLLNEHIKKNQQDLQKLPETSTLYKPFKQKQDTLEKVKYSFNLYIK